MITIGIVFWLLCIPAALVVLAYLCSAVYRRYKDNQMGRSVIESEPDLIGDEWKTPEQRANEWLGEPIKPKTIEWKEVLYLQQNIFRMKIPNLWYGKYGDDRPETEVADNAALLEYLKGVQIIRKDGQVCNVHGMVDFQVHKNPYLDREAEEKTAIEQVEKCGHHDLHTRDGVHTTSVNLMDKIQSDLKERMDKKELIREVTEQVTQQILKNLKDQLLVLQEEEKRKQEDDEFFKQVLEGTFINSPDGVPVTTTESKHVWKQEFSRPKAKAKKPKKKSAKRRKK